jgi:hypothetical protein
VSGANESRPQSAGAEAPDLEELCRRFEDAWAHGRPSLDRYLPPPGPARWPALVELVHIDLEVRLKAGEVVRVEKYLRCHPELAGERAVVLELIAAEYRLRRRHEPGLAAAEFLARFPQYRANLPAVLQAADLPGAAERRRSRGAKPSAPAGTIPFDPSATCREAPPPVRPAPAPAPARPENQSGGAQRPWGLIIVIAVALAAALVAGCLFLLFR